MKYLIIPLFFVFLSPKIYGQIYVVPSTQLPLLEIKDIKGITIQTIQLPEVVIWAISTKSGENIFAWTSDKIFRINVKTTKIETIRYQQIKDISKESDFVPFEHMEQYFKGEVSKDIISDKQTEYPDKLQFATNVTTNRQAMLTPLQFSTFSEDKLFLQEDITWMHHGTEDITMVTNDITRILVADFSTSQFYEYAQLKIQSPRSIGTNFNNTSMLLLASANGSIQFYDLASNEIKKTVWANVNNPNLKGKSPQLVTANIGGKFLVYTLNGKGNSIKDQWQYTAKFNIENNYQLEYETYYEGEKTNTKKNEYKKSVFWEYTYTEDRPKYSLLKLPEIDWDKRAFAIGKIKKKDRAAFEKKEKEWNEYKPKIDFSRDSVQDLNNQITVEWQKWDYKEHTHTYVFSDEALTDQLFYFKGVLTVHMNIEQHLVVSYFSGTTEVYNIHTKKLIKTSKKKPTSIDDF